MNGTYIKVKGGTLTSDNGFIPDRPTLKQTNSTAAQLAHATRQTLAYRRHVRQRKI